MAFCFRKKSGRMTLVPSCSRFLGVVLWESEHNRCRDFTGSPVSKALIKAKSLQPLPRSLCRLCRFTPPMTHIGMRRACRNRVHDVAKPITRHCSPRVPFTRTACPSNGILLQEEVRTGDPHALVSWAWSCGRSEHNRCRDFTGSPVSKALIKAKSLQPLPRSLCRLCRLTPPMTHIGMRRACRNRVHDVAAHHQALLATSAIHAHRLPV